MPKHASMVESNLKRSEEMIIDLKLLLDEMIRKNEQISVGTLTKKTKYSRSYFYHSTKARELVNEYKIKQKQNGLPCKSMEAITKAKDLKIKNLEKQILKMVPPEDYEKVKCENNDLREEVKYLRNELYRKEYDDL